MAEFAATDWREAVLRRFREIPVEPEPFPHLYAEGLFPQEVYERLLSVLPAPEEMPANKKATNPYGVHRRSLPINAETLPGMAHERQRFWADLHGLICGPAFIAALVDKHRSFLMARYGAIPPLRARLEIFVDFENYQIRPHTDAPHKAFTLLFYLPRDRSQLDLGTSIFVPKDPSLRSEKATQFPFELFDTVKKVGFAPNSIFGFMKTERSFHGREPVTGAATRRYLLNVAYMLPARAP